MDDRAIRHFDQVDPLFSQFLAGVTGFVIANQPGRSGRSRISRKFPKQSDLVFLFSAPEANQNRRIYSMLLRYPDVLLRFLLYAMDSFRIWFSCAV